MDTLCPLLRQWLGKRGAGLAAAVRQQVEAVERDMLEVGAEGALVLSFRHAPRGVSQAPNWRLQMLTFRRERDWLALVRWAEITRKAGFLSHPCAARIASSCSVAPQPALRSAACRSLPSTCASLRVTCCPHSWHTCIRSVQALVTAQECCSSSHDCGSLPWITAGGAGCCVPLVPAAQANGSAGPAHSIYPVCSCC
jgi:hypothetical protein